jgi:XTP/dITP diphosphohydrolase
MKELLVATGNRGKLVEIRELLGDKVQKLYSLADFPGLPQIIEDGESFAENAIKKASQIAGLVNMPVLADDSGLVVSALKGEPGVYSARYAGEGATDAGNNGKLLRALSDVPKDRRDAAFRCVIALCMPDGTCTTFDGELRGEIGFGLQGVGGFGYDPLFIVPGFGKTLAELPLEVKNAISHRAKAMEKFLDFLRGL